MILKLILFGFLTGGVCVNKDFKNYEEQIEYLNNEKEILVEEEDKIYLIRQGYFN